MPHWPTATTRRSPCVAALVGTARLRTRAPAPNACRKLRRLIGCNMRGLLPGRRLDGRPMTGGTERFTVGQGPREVKGACTKGGLPSHAQVRRTSALKKLGWCGAGENTVWVTV